MHDTTRSLVLYCSTGSTSITRRSKDKKSDHMQWYPHRFRDHACDFSLPSKTKRREESSSVSKKWWGKTNRYKECHDHHPVFFASCQSEQKSRDYQFFLLFFCVSLNVRYKMRDQPFGPASTLSVILSFKIKPIDKNAVSLCCEHSWSFCFIFTHSFSHFHLLHEGFAEVSLRDSWVLLVSDDQSHADPPPSSSSSSSSRNTIINIMMLQHSSLYERQVCIHFHTRSLQSHFTSTQHQRHKLLDMKIRGRIKKGKRRNFSRLTSQAAGETKICFYIPLQYCLLHKKDGENETLINLRSPREEETGEEKKKKWKERQEKKEIRFCFRSPLLLCCMKITAWASSFLFLFLSYSCLILVLFLCPESLNPWMHSANLFSIHFFMLIIRLSFNLLS